MLYLGLLGIVRVAQQQPPRAPTVPGWSCHKDSGHYTESGPVFHESDEPDAYEPQDATEEAETDSEDEAEEVERKTKKGTKVRGYPCSLFENPLSC